MAAADTARLIASLELQDRKFQQGVSRSLTGIGKLEGRLGRLGTHAKRGVQNATANLAKLGAVAGVALGAAITAGIDSLAELESATTSVDGAIKQMGLTGQVTGAQIAKWANEIEAATDAAFDDKEITASAATLIRFGKVTTSNLRPALQVMTDLAVKTGSVDSAASLLAKALADPTKAAGKLARSGVILTAAQEKQIKSLVKAGKVGKAQKVILDALSKTTQNAARDSAGAFGDMKNTLADTVEDAQRLVAEGAFPVLQKLGTKIQEALANPDAMNDIRNLGQAAAGFLDSAIEFGQRVPWTQIKDALRIGGQGAKAILDAFVSLPPWVQTAVISGWGLNKLTGGALGDIVGELSKGLIKGVLGITAAVVNVNGGVVNGGPQVPGGAAAGGAAAMGPLAFLGTAAAGAAVGAAATAIAREVGSAVNKTFFGSDDRTGQIFSQITRGGPFGALLDLPASFDKVVNAINGNGDLFEALIGKLPTFPKNQPAPGTAGFGSTGGPTGFATAAEIVNRLGETHSEQVMTTKAVEAAKQAQVDQIRQTGSTTGTNIRGTTSAVQSASSSITGAIYASRPIVTTTVTLNVTPAGVEKSTNTTTQYGNRNGSSGGGSGNGAVRKYE